LWRRRRRRQSSRRTSRRRTRTSWVPSTCASEETGLSGCASGTLQGDLRPPTIYDLRGPRSRKFSELNLLCKSCVCCRRTQPTYCVCVTQLTRNRKLSRVGIFATRNIHLAVILLLSVMTAHVHNTRTRVHVRVTSELFAPFPALDTCSNDGHRWLLVRVPVISKFGHLRHEIATSITLRPGCLQWTPVASGTDNLVAISKYSSRASCSLTAYSSRQFMNNPLPCDESVLAILGS
jgi:hypothetical protein